MHDYKVFAIKWRFGVAATPKSFTGFAELNSIGIAGGFDQSIKFDSKLWVACNDELPSFLGEP